MSYKLVTFIMFLGFMAVHIFSKQDLAYICANIWLAVGFILDAQKGGV